jgi:hypothetical protein
MKHLPTFEGFVKSYGQKMTQEDFEALPVGATVLYKGAQYEVEENNGATIVIKPVKGGSPTMVNLAQFNQGGAIVESYGDFINENEELLNEDAMAALAIFMQALMMSGPVIAMGIRNGAFDDLRTPAQVVRDWQKDRIVGPAVERLSQDPDVIEFLKLPGTKQRGKWQELLKTKLTDKEMKYINSISRYRVQDGK